MLHLALGRPRSPSPVRGPGVCCALLALRSGWSWPRHPRPRLDAPACRIANARADRQHKLTPPATPLLSPAASREPTPAPSATPGTAPAPVLVFRADPRLATTFASLPDSAEVRHLFNV